MNTRKLLLKASAIALTVAALFGPAANVVRAEPPWPLPPVPQIQPPLESLVYDPGAQFIDAGPNITVTLPIGWYVHLNISCNNCVRGQEINYVVYVEKSVTLNLNGSVWKYARQPVEMDGLCDIGRDFWPSSWPNGWPQTGTLVFPCGITNAGAPGFWSPNTVVTATSAYTLPVTSTNDLTNTSELSPTGTALPYNNGEASIQKLADSQYRMIDIMEGMISKTLELQAQLKDMQDRLSALEAKKSPANGTVKKETTCVLAQGIVPGGQGENLTVKACGWLGLSFYAKNIPEKMFVFFAPNGVTISNFNGTLSHWTQKPAAADIGNRDRATLTDVQAAGVTISGTITPLQ